jgi:uncharacterized membrane protein
MQAILNAPLIIQVHILAAVIAVALGSLNLAHKKGGLTHRTVGWTWVVAMLVLAIGSFWIRGPKGGLSWIHALSVISTINIALAIYFARTRNFKAHKGCMIGGFSGLIIAGAFTFMPTRLMYQAVFG